ncbi:TauD/TfdA family dioxygenase [Streptomyces roseirectus]|uniref:TauD/TfdA family dioxygenase n=1 Tax=Streptomyces roseirectus TaxID=2768066 RepID=A0A7H0IQ89_9ACTN|nr:TauD/TfdA family dioxygenase [Streptomyces roseirectus]QNP74955.1 TauD/TfdA family dioxygenase [Streptomyces roseirectus]
MITLLPRLPVPETFIDFLGEHSHCVPGPWLHGSRLRDEVTDAYEALRAASPEAQEVTRRLRDLLDDPYGEGCAVLGLAPVLDHYGLGYGQKAATIVLSWLGTPLRLRDQQPLWHTQSVDLLLSPVRTTAPRPLHLDAVSAVRPPDYTAFLCVRPDPRGGGHVLVSQTRRAVNRLGEDERALLAETVFHHDEHTAVTGVGGALDVFPVLDGLSPLDGFVRFHPDMAADRAPTDLHTSALHALHRELTVGQRRFPLTPGDLLIVNQHLSAHGRDALGHGQTTLPEERRRTTWQTYLHTANSPA